MAVHQQRGGSNPFRGHADELVFLVGIAWITEDKERGDDDVEMAEMVIMKSSNRNNYANGSNFKYAGLKRA